MCCLNESNRFVKLQTPTAMRMGVNCLSGQVVKVGLIPINGDACVFVGRSRKVTIKRWNNQPESE